MKPAKDWTGQFLLLLMLFASITTVAAAYRYFVSQDYIIIAHVSCDPSLQFCFIGDGDEASIFYKIIEKPAYTIPSCNGWEGGCRELVCEPNDANCKEILCDPALEEVCSGPSEVE